MQEESINLSELDRGVFGLAKAWCQACGEAARVCLDDQGHSSGVVMKVEGEQPGRFHLYWNDVDDGMIRTYADQAATTEHGAYGMSLLLIKKVTPYTLCERSRRGGGFDFWLRKADETHFFQQRARLEVSGIRRGSKSEIESRVRLKLDQTKKSNGASPALIMVIEFSRPMARMVQK